MANIEDNKQLAKELVAAASPGCDLELPSTGVNWDMVSSISRGRVDQTFEQAWLEEDDAEAVRVIEL